MGSEHCINCRSLVLDALGSCPILGGTPCLDSKGSTLILRDLDGRYTVLEALATGGMGTVFRARQKATGRDVAVKMLPATTARRDDAILRLVTEARALARLNDPHVVSIVDFGRSPTGLVYLVMELLVGTTVRDHVVEHGPMPP